MYISPEILQAISDLSKNNTAILITDNMDCFNRFTKPALQLEKYFSFIFNSCDFGVLKDDTTFGGLFKKVCDMHKFDITKSVLVDNSEENCAIFTKLGGRALLVKNSDDTLYILIHIADTVINTIARNIHIFDNLSANNAPNTLTAAKKMLNHLQLRLQP